MDVSFDFKPGDRVAIVGKVGTGKSSLLLAALGEIPVNKGKIYHEGEISYAE
jgi:ABC-type multidrug transport system fused ATPase/permease subunit